MVALVQRWRPIIESIYIDSGVNLIGSRIDIMIDVWNMDVLHLMASTGVRADLVNVDLDKFRVAVATFLMLFFILSAAFVLSCAGSLARYE